MEQEVEDADSNHGLDRRDRRAATGLLGNEFRLTCPVRKCGGTLRPSKLADPIETVVWAANADGCDSPRL